MSKLLLVAGGVLTVSALVLFGLPLLVVTALLGGSQANAAGCLVPGSHPGGAFEAGYLETISIDGLDAQQVASAATIVAVGEQLQMTPRGIIIALAVASQESRFQNYANDGVGGDLRPDQLGVERSLTFPHDAVGTDHGSVNAFQQQYPWWGTLEELMDPPTAARKFYDALNQVTGWQQMTVTVAAQRVQRSASPGAYADDELIATQLHQRLAGVSGHITDSAAAPAPTTGEDAGAPAAGTSTSPDVAEAGCGATGAGGAVSANGWALPMAPGTYQLTSGYGPRRSPTDGSSNFHAGLDFGAPSGTPIYVTADGTVTSAGLNKGGCGNLVIVHTAPNVDTYYAHQVDGGTKVSVGDVVSAGSQIGAVGTTGDSTGNHLHFEVRIDGATTDPLLFLRQQGVDPGSLP
ncbi:Murein DD-endopeptidase MepM and murein hydrolase activator NlpD, contain LysM domain [Modestobacter sp. DSM 44400]|uniref:M23 family metallopeptidase n=1 Tax=Modestobacter sp. DSM 44400 TaxID=1550230 RepID=UPI0008941E62|nr:M23 family metallopeptidase [Modestobacter sp. DSM 44400]SDY76914.1 Murein DD-endopeptidase MepM and murein hydrolase activator NlpD, contain LysM domain [Modestobacter sp. DSM 44400]